MKRIYTIIPALIILGMALTATGCVVHGTGGVQVRAHAHYTPPRLVYVSPGVQVVYDYHEPVFYSDGYYWRNDGYVWYRSSYHSHGWVRADAYVPAAIVRIDRPSYYVRYRGEVRGRVYEQPAYHPQRVQVRTAPSRAVIHDNRPHGEVRVRARARGHIRVR